MHFAINPENLHPSTELALDCLHALHSKAQCDTVLDIGCGNGLLSIVCAQIWDADVLAIDISDAAVKDSTENVIEHKLQEKIHIHRSDRFTHPSITKQAPYRLIIANMLDQWLIEMAVDIKKHVKPEGYVILSGMLAWLAADTKRSYTSLGFEIIEEFNTTQWCSCVLKAPKARQ